MPTEELSNRSCAFVDLFSYFSVIAKEHLIASSPEWLLINDKFIAESKCQKHGHKSQQLGTILSHFQPSLSSQPISLTDISVSVLKVNLFIDDPPLKFYVHFLSPPSEPRALSTTLLFFSRCYRISEGGISGNKIIIRNLLS